MQYIIIQLITYYLIYYWIQYNNIYLTKYSLTHYLTQYNKVHLNVVIATNISNQNRNEIVKSFCLKFIESMGIIKKQKHWEMLRYYTEEAIRI